MTLEEAIEHTKDIAKDVSECTDCRVEHKQLTGWLEELLAYRKMDKQGEMEHVELTENEKKKAENADKDGEFLNGFGVDPEEPDTNFYKPEDDATENVSPEEESENVDQ